MERSNRAAGAPVQGKSQMSAAKSHLLICSCEKTMPLDAQAIGRGCAAEITQANQLCGLELERFKQALADGAPVTVACTQEAPLFREVAESFPQAQLTFVNIRETGGWSTDAAKAGPKAAALIAAAGEDMPPISLVTLESNGVALVYGRDEVAIEAAQRLADRLDITVLLTRPGDVTPRRSNEFPVLKGTIRNARGHLGAFELAIDDYALPLPSSRAKLRVRACARRRDLDLRSDPRSQRRHCRYFPRMNCVRDICGPIRATAPRSNARSRMPAIWSAPSTSRASSTSKRLAVRAFALRHHRMHALPRSVSDRRDHAERECGRHRREHMRGLRLLRFGLPDRSRILFAASCGRADAAVAHAAADLSQGRRQRRRRVVSRWRAWRCNDRCVGAVRRRPAGERAAASRQRSDAARAGGDRGGLCLWRQRRRGVDARKTQA